jgi:hypothetical protein
MRAQPVDIEPGPKTGCRREVDRQCELSSPARDALRLLSEQAAIPLDQLARLLDISLERTLAALQELDRARCVDHRRFFVTDGPWFWPTWRGARLAGTGYCYAAPVIALLAHRRAVHEVRLHLAERAPQGRWLSERAVYRRREPDDHLPDALFEIDRERHAIEVELSRKSDREIRQILTKHSNRYDAVVYFCGSRTYRMMLRLAGEGCWPKLIVRRLPEGH